MARIRKQQKQPAATAVVPRTDSHLLPALTLAIVALATLMVLAYARNGIYQTYVTLWKSVSESAPNKRRAHENYGQALSTQGSLSRNPEEAKRLYDMALKEFNTVMSLRDDGSVPLRDLYREIGVVYFRLGEIDQSITAWETGLRHAPYDPSLLNNLSIALMQKGRFDEAAAHAMNALAGDPNMPQALNTLGQVYMAKHEYDKAVEYFLKAIEREPDVPARYWNVALAYDQARKFDLAIQYAKKYQSMEPDPVGRNRAAGFIQFVMDNRISRRP